MQRTLIYVDVNTKSQVDASGKPVRSLSAYPSFERGQWQILCVNFVQVSTDDLGIVTLTPYDLSGSSYLFVADNNFTDDDSLMLKSYQSITRFNENDATSNRINIEGDWIDGTTADLSLGQLSIRVNSDTTKFVEALGTKTEVTSGLYINIKQYTAGIANPSSIAWLPFVAKNTVRDWSEAQEIPPSGQQVVSFLDSYFKLPMEYEYSVDGVHDWHTERTFSDSYYRQRLKSVGGAWGSAVLIVNGEDAPHMMIQYSANGSNWGTSPAGSKYIRFSTDNGETWSPSKQYVGSDGEAAGFGTPVIAVKTGEPGTEASAAVSASGEDTEKVFTFDMTIPRGATGKAAGFGNITASAQTVPPEYSAIATVTSSGTSESKNLAFSFQIPQGKKGDPMKVDATGLTTDLDNYAAESKGFVFLATNTGNIYIKNSDSVGDWSDPVGFQGPEGTAAGFGTPTVSITALEPEEQPTASVIASGENTRKVFAFSFGLPKGHKGNDGLPGTIENFEIPVTSLSDGKIKIKVNALPVMLKSPSGQFYPVEKTRMTGSSADGWSIDPAPYLGYENASSFTGTWYVYCAGAVQGEKGKDGKDGASFDPDVTGVFAERSQYDSQPKGFSFLATDQEGAIYVKNSNSSADWSDAIPFRGPKGDAPEVSIVNDKWVIDGVDTGKPSRGAPGPMADVSIADNGNWIVNGVDTGKSSRGKGANIVMSPTPPAEPFEGMILVSSLGESTSYFDLESLPVVVGDAPPSDAVEGTIFIMEV